ncbi:hypothetical protein OAN307_c00090 [Octadecabacter antarcticus 307]|uniref:Uncharacterized protein n=1 Tax=Octadecabacter antarcticus 307 TaxID=391626 RepID=M9R206_9RHOB|nr:hypothetical protein [Octadecabacter antarcticus]AGI65793.1 hypothetical protein OAN307_c00090 [Octadecabacter antarcticus 307]
MIVGVLAFALTAGQSARANFTPSTIQHIGSINDWQQEQNPVPFNGITN